MSCNCNDDRDPNKLSCEVLYKALENHIDFLYSEDHIKEVDLIIDGLEAANKEYYKRLFALLTPEQTPVAAKKKAVKK
jgi:hypothetical protein